MKQLSTHSDWNFQNKLLLMEAELHYALKEFDEAASCYEASIKAAQDHKFIHEEGLASELAAMFFHEQENLPMSCRLFKQSMECYENWGAHAVAERVGGFIRKKFDSEMMDLPPIDEIIVHSGLQSSSDRRSKKRLPELSF